MKVAVRVPLPDTVRVEVEAEEEATLNSALADHAENL
jgi:hypothetical protein